MNNHTRRTSSRRLSLLALLLLTLSAGCSDALAVAGLSDLSGYWVGRYDAEYDFFLDLDDDAYGLYGRAGLRRGGELGDLYVDGVREGSRIRIYADEVDADFLVFEGQVSGSNRIDGIVYLEGFPEPVVLRR